MAKINSIESIDWSWFDNATPQDVILDVVDTVNDIKNIITSLEITAEEKNLTVDDIENLGYSLAGVNQTSPYPLVSQEEWYNLWLSQQQVTTFSFSVNFIIEKVKVNQTGESENIVTYFNNLMKYILYRHFSTPIPSGYPNAGNKPRLVDNDSDYYTDMTTALYNFFINGGEGVNGIGNDTIAEMCSNFDRTTIQNYTPIKEWCGCFSPVSAITTLAKTTYPNSQSYTTECDPLCIYPGAIKVVDSNGSNGICNSTICIMSDVMLGNTDLNGVINLNQNCPCSNSSQPCFCIIDVSVTSLLDKMRSPDGGSMADPVTFQQYCPGAQCFVKQADGQLKQVTCQNDNPGNTKDIVDTTGGETIKKFSSSIWFLYFSIIMVFVTLIQCARYIGFEPKYKVKGLLKPKVKLSKNIRSSDIGFLKKI